ncbi:MAG: DUF1841 family protein, partial [Nitrospinaceae bacterium]|nr:DUF1841 family protein [Nitrospinaceae bacterium]NIR56922.1 DUF1841 family protein [Nitrospinaceae bacterium]NIS87384.1 DUF1841 family protein [Nitrospinaceae bacterium]NIT84236.1 DUF1841 family protein [Nitrospinaceae bacterium]NIU46424.1 DUF1841 family protein [Nitrospinaceae bacterium]
TQVRILRVAADREQGRPVEQLDECVARVMDMHPEFDEIWKQGELATYPQEINGQVVSPFVHTVLHVTVDQQIQNEDPPFVSEAYKRLSEQGMDDHEVLHAIIAVYADLYFTTFRRGKQFDMLDYQSRLSYLSYEDAEEEAEEG